MKRIAAFFTLCLLFFISNQINSQTASVIELPASTSIILNKLIIQQTNSCYSSKNKIYIRVIPFEKTTYDLCISKFSVIDTSNALFKLVNETDKYWIFDSIKVPIVQDFDFHLNKLFHPFIDNYKIDEWHPIEGPYIRIDILKPEVIIKQGYYQ